VEPLAKEKVLSFFNYHLEKYGDRPEALRWTPEGQLKRYHTFLDIAPDLNNQKILDFGCGIGDFYGFLKRRGINVRYTGVDINENFISLAQKKFPECTFRLMDLDEEPLHEYYDYIFLCGVFNLKVPGVQNDLRNALVKLFNHCNKGLALSALSTHAPEKAPELAYTSPEDLVKFSIENLSPYIALRHDRIESDFTLFVYPSLNEIKL
jgi:SAM-dependent methyltransferase